MISKGDLRRLNSEEQTISIVYSKNGVRIRLTEERWDHIVEHHPEMRKERTKLLETVSEPEFIQEGDRGELIAVRLYPSTSLGLKYLIALYRETSSEDGFVITGYLTNRPAKWREVIWKK